MLILSRKLGERIRITLPDWQHIWLKLVGVELSRAKLGIDAPRDVQIAREEILSDHAPRDGERDAP